MSDVLTSYLVRGAISSALCSGSSTPLYYVVHVVTRAYPTACEVYDYVLRYAVCSDPRALAWRLAYGCRHCEQSAPDWALRNLRVFRESNRVHLAAESLRRELRLGFCMYTKLAVIREGMLWWQSPFLGNADYNACRDVVVQGNERLCTLLVSLSNKFYQSQLNAVSV